MDASSRAHVPEASIRYEGWRIVAVCFLLATFGWGLGFYGQSVYVAELHRLHGWPTSLISSGTTFFYLFGAALVVFVAEAIKAFGLRNCLIVGTLSDRLRRRKPVVIVSSHIYGAIWLVWLSGIVLPPVATFSLFALMGLTTASFTLSWACAKEVNPPALSGMSTSVANMGGFLMGALLQPAVGWVMDRRWDGTLVNGVRIYLPEDYRWGLLLIAGAAWLGAAAAWFLRETGCRNIHQDIEKEHNA